MKWLVLIARCLGWAAVTAVVGLLLLQHRIIYYPRPYDGTAIRELEMRGGRRLVMQTAQGRQVAYYLPARKNPQQAPEFIWFVFGGNGSLALDYAGEPLRWDERFAYVFADYPGYGECEGSASPEAIRETTAALGKAVKAEWGWNDLELQTRCGVLGHSLGCAASLICARELGLQRAVLCAPFTTMTDMARRTVGWPLCYLNRHRFDNVESIRQLIPSGFYACIFHGQEDSVIPVAMSRSLVDKFPTHLELTEVPGCDHNEIVLAAQEEIGRAMQKLTLRSPR